MQRGVYINVGKFNVSFLVKLQLINVEALSLRSSLVDFPQQKSLRMFFCTCNFSMRRSVFDHVVTPPNHRRRH